MVVGYLAYWWRAGCVLRWLPLQTDLFLSYISVVTHLMYHYQFVVISSWCSATVWHKRNSSEHVVIFIFFFVKSIRCRELNFWRQNCDGAVCCVTWLSVTDSVTCSLTLWLSGQVREVCSIVRTVQEWYIVWWRFKQRIMGGAESEAGLMCFFLLLKLVR